MLCFVLLFVVCNDDSYVCIGTLSRYYREVRMYCMTIAAASRVCYQHSRQSFTALEILILVRCAYFQLHARLLALMLY